MNQYLKIFFLFLILQTLSAKEDPQKLWQQILKQIKDNDLQPSLQKFEKYFAIKNNKNLAEAHYQRSMVYMKLKAYEQALIDIDLCINFKPKYLQYYVIKGIILNSLTQYKLAETIFDFVISKDEYNLLSYYYRGLITAQNGKLDSACRDFKKSKNEITNAAYVYENFCSGDTFATKQVVHFIPTLTQKSKDKNYGYSDNKPIKVGKNILGNAANEDMYLNLLRDKQKNSIEFERLGKCCPYMSKTKGIYYLDKFDITFYDEKNKKQLETIFLTHEEFEEPKILYNLETLSQIDTILQQNKNATTN